MPTDSTFPHSPEDDAAPSPGKTQLGYEILRSIRRIIRRVSLYSRDLSEEVGLTVPQLTCLKAIAEMDVDTVTIGAVSKRISLSPATVSRIVERLVQGGLVARKRWESDRRKVFLELTEEGTERYETLPTPLDDGFLTRLHQLPEEERREIFEVLERLVELMDAEKVDAAPILVEGVDMRPGA